MWTCSVWPFMSLSVAFISFAEKSSHRFLPIIFSVIEDIALIELKSGGHRARLLEKEYFYLYRAQFEGNPLRFVHTHNHVRAVMTQKSCAVGMCNAKLGNHLKEARMGFFVAVVLVKRWKITKKGI